jgi:hypothetical protein
LLEFSAPVLGKQGKRGFGLNKEEQIVKPKISGSRMQSAPTREITTDKVCRTLITAACAAVLCAAGYGQTLPATLDIEAQKCPFYFQDVADPSKFATAEGPVPVTVFTNFTPVVVICDIVAVNGKPARGAAMIRGTLVRLSPNPGPGVGISDVTRSYVMDYQWEIQDAYGSHVGTINAIGFGAGPPPLGSGEDASAGNFSVIGGTGAFLGVHGQAANLPAKGDLGARRPHAGFSEDPRYRRNYAGANLRAKMHLYPMTRPEVIAVFHSDDFSPVTPDKPARIGEYLKVSASGLGPVRPDLELGKPFPAWVPGKEHVVNSPLELTVGGQPAEVRSAIGWPGQTNIYLVDFRVPDGVKSGLASLALAAAWIPGPEVKIPVR